MTVYLNNVKSDFSDIYQARKQLNSEFFKRGRIIDAVSFLYYPVQHGPMSHAEMEIEGSCYYFRSCVGPCTIPDIKSYHKRIYNIRRGEWDELAFVRFSIAVTPEQLHKIQNDIENLRSMVGLTCMHGVKRALKRYTGYSIPFPICLFPTSTAATLYISKKKM